MKMPPGGPPARQGAKMRLMLRSQGTLQSQLGCSASCWGPPSTRLGNPRTQWRSLAGLRTAAALSAAVDKFVARFMLHRGPVLILVQ